MRPFDLRSLRFELNCCQLISVCSPIWFILCCCQIQAPPCYSIFLFIFLSVGLKNANLFILEYPFSVFPVPLSGCNFDFTFLFFFSDAIVFNLVEVEGIEPSSKQRIRSLRAVLFYYFYVEVSINICC